MRLAASFAVLAALALAPVARAADLVPAASAAPAPVPVPVPRGTYQFDKAHTSLIFRVNHLGFSTFTGRFTQYDAKLELDPTHLAASRVNVTIDPRSIESDNAPDGFLDMLRGEQWLDAAKFPAMKFASRSVEVTGDNRLRVHGELTLHGVTKPLVLEARYNGGYAGHPYDPQARVGFSASGSFKRSDFGVSLGVPAPGSTFGVGDEVQVVLETELTGPPLGTNQR